MGRLTDVPEPLRDLAAQIPPGLAAWEVQAHLGQARVEYALADDQPPDEAARTRQHADRVLTALPVEQYLAQLTGLNAALEAAARAEDFSRAGEVFRDLLALQVTSPQPEAALRLTMPITADELDDKNRAPSRVLGVR
jgi:hypothetical protein